MDGDDAGMYYGFALVWPIVWAVALFAGIIMGVRALSSRIQRNFMSPFGMVDEFLWIISRREIQRDSTGILYRGLCHIEGTRLEVKVTDEQGDHWMRVPHGFRGDTPAVTTAQEAVAWTFNMDHQEYKPVFTS